MFSTFLTLSEFLCSDLLSHVIRPPVAMRTGITLITLLYDLSKLFVTNFLETTLILVIPNRFNGNGRSKYKLVLVMVEENPKTLAHVEDDENVKKMCQLKTSSSP